jgi:hypothetical protein
MILAIAVPKIVDGAPATQGGSSIRSEHRKAINRDARGTTGVDEGDSHIVAIVAFAICVRLGVAKDTACGALARQDCHSAKRRVRMAIPVPHRE